MLKKCLFVILALASFAYAQGPQTSPTPPEAVETVNTEEIKLNVLALDAEGNLARDLQKEDLVINEDGRLHQASSVRRIPANVLLLLDVGTEISAGKRNQTTRDTAKSLINALRPEDSFAVMQYGDTVQTLADWTQDKRAANEALNKKMGFGRRSIFVKAVDAAIDFFSRTPRDNRHLILITDGIDSFNDELAKTALTRKLFASDINVHVVSYTKLQQAAITVPKSVTPGGTRPATQALPPGAGLQLPGGGAGAVAVPLATVNLDREMIRHRKQQIERLKASERYLTTIADDLNGEIFLPDSPEEMVEKMRVLARNIDSQYVATYVSKRPLDEAPNGETRIIEASSRRPGVEIQGRRKLVVANNR